MSTQKIIWTLLPNGIVEKNRVKNHRVSVVVSPRLTSNTGTLQPFQEFLDWPKTVSEATFKAIVKTISGEQEVLLKPGIKYNSDLWRKLFTEETPVEGFKFTDIADEKKVKIHSYNIRNILGFIEKNYANVAVNSPEDIPTLTPWDKMDPDLREMLREAGTFNTPNSNSIGNIVGFKRFFDIGGKLDFRINTYEKDLYEADRFYRRRRNPKIEDWKRHPDYKKNSSTLEEPKYDFHRIVAALASYPEVMRELGLVLDFTIGNFPSDITDGKIRLKISWNNNHNPSKDETPWTEFQSEKESFTVRPRPTRNDLPRPPRPGREIPNPDGEIKKGLLNLEKSNDHYTEPGNQQFGVYQVDPDGAALKTVDFVLTAQNFLSETTTYTTGDKQGLPALRSGGLGVFRHNRKEKVIKDAEQANTNNQILEGVFPDKEIELFADDLLRGYRVDVMDVEKGEWYSLCEREGEYKLVSTDTNDIENDEILDISKYDEGYVSGPSTTTDPPKPPDDPDNGKPENHYLHETLFRWTGWSLCCPRPERFLKDEAIDGNKNLQKEVPTDEEPVAENGCGVTAKFKVKPNSLPRLRFGKAYRFRARIVDLAGNSLKLEDISKRDLTTGATNPVGYWRFEPIDPPVMVHRTKVSEGESLERMVIRSNYNVSAKEYLKSEEFKEAIGQSETVDFEYHKKNERHFVPPKSSQQQCELHGAFDDYMGDWESIKKGYALAAKRDAQTLSDNLEGAEVEFITPDSVKKISTIEEGNVPNMMPEGDSLGDRVAGGQYIIHREAQIITPYLPDCASEGVAIRATDGNDIPGVTCEMDLGESCKIRKIPEKPILSLSCFDPPPQKDRFVILINHSNNSNKWHDRNGFRLILAERKAIITSRLEIYNDNGEPVWDEEKRTLTLFVPKGRIIHLVYSSFANEKEITKFGIPKWISKLSDREYVCDLAKHGANWMLTPFRELTLVHASQAPVWNAMFIEPLIIEREFGSHEVNLFKKFRDNKFLSSRIHLHRPSTSKIELEAEWYEWIDDPVKEAPERVHFKGQLGEIKLTDNIIREQDDYAKYLLLKNEHLKYDTAELLHCVTDIKNNIIQVDDFPDIYRGCFEYIKLKKAVDAQWPDLKNEWGAPISDCENKQRGDVHVLGDTKFRLIKYRLRATTRFHEYLPPHFAEEQENNPESEILTRLGPVAKGAYVLIPNDIDYDAGTPLIPINEPGASNKQSLVPASAPPLDPKVLYIVPTMKWEKSELNATRHGNGLRVWLDRPWFSSGDGELLGVVIANDAFKVIKQEYQQLVSQWGVDPFWASPTPKTIINTNDFPAMVHSEVIKLQELPDKDEVTIVGHRVHWDKDRKLWYCDIEINPAITTYMPFVRLALVRYQPNALYDTSNSNEIKNAKISKVVYTDFAQVLPTRTVKINKNGRMIEVSLSGTTAAGPILKEGNFIKDTQSGFNRIELVLQTRNSNIESDLEWKDDAIVGLFFGEKYSMDDKTAEFLYSATMAGNKLPARGIYRLMLREFERFYSDDYEFTSKMHVVEERLVFAYEIPLPL